MKKCIYAYSLIILILLGCSKNETPEPKENVVNSPFKVKYEIITDNNAVYNPSNSLVYTVRYNIENGSHISSASESFNKYSKMPNVWSKEFTATLTARPYSLSLEATIKLNSIAGNQFIIGNIYVNDALVSTQKGDLDTFRNASTINFGWAAQ